MNEKGIDPPLDVGFSNLEPGGNSGYWMKWFRRLQDVFPKIQTYGVTINPSSVSANTTSEQTFSVPGLSTSDIVYINKPTHTTGLGICGCRVSATDTLAITFCNVTASPIDAGSESYLVVSIRR